MAYRREQERSEQNPRGSIVAKYITPVMLVMAAESTVALKINHGEVMQFVSEPTSLERNHINRRNKESQIDPPSDARMKKLPTRDDDKYEQASQRVMDVMSWRITRICIENVVNGGATEQQSHQCCKDKNHTVASIHARFVVAHSKAA